MPLVFTTVVAVAAIFAMLAVSSGGGNTPARTEVSSIALQQDRTPHDNQFSNPLGEIPSSARDDKQIVDTSVPLEHAEQKGISTEDRSVSTERLRKELKEYLDRPRRESRQNQLTALLTRTFGHAPDDPVFALQELDDTALQALQGDWASEMGRLVGELASVDDWLSWFERAGPMKGARGDAATTTFRWAVDAQGRALRHDSKASERVLAIVGAYLADWHNEKVNVGARVSLLETFFDICPVEGGLGLIRRWTVETPHGDEVIEMRLCEALQFWPFSKASDIALEALAIGRAGAIKGVIRCWTNAKDRQPGTVWTIDDMRSMLAPALGEAVKVTSFPAGILYSEVFAAPDFLRAQRLEIGQALLARRDSASCSSYGFRFLNMVDAHSTNTVWRDWFYSNDTYKITAACSAATGSGMADIVRNPHALDRMQSLANDDARPGSLRSAAALALSVQDHMGRAIAVFEAWLAKTEISDPMLLALGRIALRAPREKVESLLEEIITNTSQTAARSHYPLFLLATCAPLKALGVCETAVEHGTPLLEPESLLLAVATVEAMLPEQTRERTSAVRGRFSQVEPEWMREIRLKIEGPNQRVEHRVVSYAWSGASVRD